MQIEALRERIANQAMQIEALEGDNAHLRRHMGLNSDAGSEDIDSTGEDEDEEEEEDIRSEKSGAPETVTVPQSLLNIPWMERMRYLYLDANL